MGRNVFIFTGAEKELMEDRVERMKRAKEIAKESGLDAGDIEHALFNLTLPPWERLARGMRHAKLRRFAVKR